MDRAAAPREVTDHAPDASGESTPMQEGAPGPPKRRLFRAAAPFAAPAVISPSHRLANAMVNLPCQRFPATDCAWRYRVYSAGLWKDGECCARFDRFRGPSQSGLREKGAWLPRPATATRGFTGSWRRATVSRGTERGSTRPVPRRCLGLARDSMASANEGRRRVPPDVSDDLDRERAAQPPPHVPRGTRSPAGMAEPTNSRFDRVRSGRNAPSLAAFPKPSFAVSCALGFRARLSQPGRKTVTKS